MRARDVVGRRIVAVRQQRVRTPAGKTIYHLDALELDDGTTVNFDVVPLEDEAGAVDVTIWYPRCGW